MNIERMLRNFVRQQFAARAMRNEAGEFDTTVKGQTGKVLIQNPATVEANLEEQCGAPIEEKGLTKVFKYKTGKGKTDFAKVTVTRNKEGERGGNLKIEGLGNIEDLQAE